MNDIEKVKRRARELGIEINENVDDHEKGLFYEDENGELVKWDYRNEFKEIHKREDLYQLEKINIELENMSDEEVSKLQNSIDEDVKLEKVYREIKSKIQKMSKEEIKLLNETLLKEVEL